MQKEVDEILSFLPSHYLNNKEAADRLFSVASYYKIRINRGCKDCIGRAYAAIQRVQRNNYLKPIGNMYLFNDKINVAGYTFKGKVCRNNNTTVEERKAIYDSHVSRQALFDKLTIQAEVKTSLEETIDKFSKPEETTPKKRTTRRRKKKEDSEQTN